jgi:hypothetical protein
VLFTDIMGSTEIAAELGLLIFDYGSQVEGFGAICPAYQSVSWRERAGKVTFSHPVGHCRERNLDLLAFAPWSRIS